MLGFGWFLAAALATSGAPRLRTGDGAAAALLGVPVPAAAFTSAVPRPVLRGAASGAVDARSLAPALLAKGFGKKKAKKVSATPSAPAPAQPRQADRESLANAEERGRKMLEQMRVESQGGDFKPKRPGVTLTPEELAPMDPTDVMPEAVANRMLQRIIPFAALPVAAIVVLLIGFWYANTKLEYDIPPQIVAYATQAMLLLSFAGITYGVMSTQLDEEKEQTLLGAENVKRNFDSMRGVEFERIAEAKSEEELEDAEEAGIVMNQEQLARRREQEAQNTRL